MSKPFLNGESLASLHKTLSLTKLQNGPFLGGEDVCKTIAKWTSASQPILLIKGPRGIGKSTLVAKFVDENQIPNVSGDKLLGVFHCSPEKNVFECSYFVSALHHLCKEAKLSSEEKFLYNDPKSQLHELFNEVKKDSTTATRVMIIDGITLESELAKLIFDEDVLRSIPPFLRFIMTTRQEYIYPIEHSKVCRVVVLSKKDRQLDLLHFIKQQWPSNVSRDNFLDLSNRFVKWCDGNFQAIENAFLLIQCGDTTCEEILSRPCSLL